MPSLARARSTGDSLATLHRASGDATHPSGTFTEAKRARDPEATERGRRVAPRPDVTDDRGPAVFAGAAGSVRRDHSATLRVTAKPHGRPLRATGPHERGNRTMKVWIDQDLCTGDGLCEEIAPDVFTLLDDGLAYVKEGSKVFSDPGGAEGLANVPAGQEEATIESAEECPGECIFIEI
jgi:ferredoxin